MAGIRQSGKEHGGIVVGHWTTNQEVQNLKPTVKVKDAKTSNNTSKYKGSCGHIQT